MKEDSESEPGLASHRTVTRSGITFSVTLELGLKLRIRLTLTNLASTTRTNPRVGTPGANLSVLLSIKWSVVKRAHTQRGGAPHPFTCALSIPPTFRRIACSCMMAFKFTYVQVEPVRSLCCLLCWAALAATQGGQQLLCAGCK